MILGQSPTANNPVPFQRPAAANPGYVPPMPRTRFMSPNIWPFSQVLNPMRAYPAYRPQLPAGVGPHGFPQQSPVPAAVPSANVATTAPVPAIASTPSAGGGTNGFGGAGFGSHGGTRGHFHVDPYMVMRSGWIPGVAPNGSNIRSGVTNALARVNRSMPFQSMPLPPPPPPPPPPMPMPAATHGFGHHRHHHHHQQQMMMGPDELGFPGFRSFARVGAFAVNPAAAVGYEAGRHMGHHPHHRRHHHHMMQPQYQQPYQPQPYTPPSGPVPQFGAPGSDGCEWVGPRVDGISVKICDGKVISYKDAQGNVMTPGDFQGAGREGWFMRNFGWRRHHHRMA